MKKKLIAIVVPCYNEEDALRPLIDELKVVRQSLRTGYEIDIYLIDDGSNDDTLARISDLSEESDFVYYRSFAKNSGHQNALRAGLDAVINYDGAIMMDADLQHPPACIEKILELWRQTGVSIIQMTRHDSGAEAGVFKYYTSRLYYALINYLASLRMEYGSSDFRFIDHEVLQTLHESNEKELFLRGYFSWLNVKRLTMEYKPNQRVAGQSKYTFKKMLGLAKKGVIQFSDKPLRIAMNLGLLVAFLSLIYGIFLVLDYFFGGSKFVSGWTTLAVIMLFCFGVNFVILGVIGTYLAQVLRLQKNRPEYLINDERLRMFSKESYGDKKATKNKQN